MSAVAHRVGCASGEHKAAKQRLRDEVKTKLGLLTPQAVERRSKQLCDCLTAREEFLRASVVMVYLSLPQEVDLSAAILTAWQQGKTIVVPQVLRSERRMMPVEIHSLEGDFAVEASGLRNPRSGAPVPPADIDLVVAPGLAFDRAGGRLGRGGGYYDKFLTSVGLHAAVFGAGFVEQMVASVPMESHDRRMNAVATDAGVVECTQAGR